MKNNKNKIREFLLENPQKFQKMCSREPPKPIWKDALNLIIRISVICVIFTLLFTFIYGLHRNTNPDMIPMIKEGDIVTFYRLDKNYNIGDLVLLDFQGERQVRRVVARPGDTIDFKEGKLIVNGSIQNEREIYQKTWRYENNLSFPLKLNQDQIFVLGDAREDSTDSRVYGSVSINDTLGKAIFILRQRNL